MKVHAPARQACFSSNKKSRPRKCTNFVSHPKKSCVPVSRDTAGKNNTFFSAPKEASFDCGRPRIIHEEIGSGIRRIRRSRPLSSDMKPRKEGRVRCKSWNCRRERAREHAKYVIVFALSPSLYINAWSVRMRRTNGAELCRVKTKHDK